MASVKVVLLIKTVCVLVFHVAIINAKAKTNITQGSTLSTNVSSSSWPSPSGLFSFGFYPQGNGYRVGIWMATSNKTESRGVVVWTANRDDPPYSTNAELVLTNSGCLVVRWRNTHQVVQEKNVTGVDYLQSLSPATSAAMLDDGNFQLFNHSGLVWQSFDYPTDTILGGQALSNNSWLQSSKSTSDNSKGLFVLCMYGRHLASFPANNLYEPPVPYWSFSTLYGAADLNLSRSGSLFLREYNSYGYKAQNYYFLNHGSSPGINETIIYRATLDSDGIFRLYSHNIVSNSSTTVGVVWSSLEDPCEVKGICGFNSYCRVVNSKSSCSCYPGLVPINSSMVSLGCYQNFSLVDHDHHAYNFTPVDHIQWDSPPYAVETLMEEEVCKKSCLDESYCWALLYQSPHCCKYSVPLLFGKQSNDINTTALFKVVLEDVGILKQQDHSHTGPTHDESRIRSLLINLALSLGSVACLCFGFAISSFIVYEHKCRRYKKLLENSKLGLAEDFTLKSFTYSELEQATNGFSEERGRGTFGAVYRGVLAEGNRTVAVKRLEKVVEEGVREFRAEMTTIARTHHRNLVQLHGFCIEGSKKLLVYEFMSNGSLADRLFKAASKPTWRERVKLVFDVARGIFYLHEECGVHIIHCNLKPQNILLDDTWTAKISDFGLARLLMPNQAKTSRGVQETSLAYLAPEWQKNALISVKSDIYSFGIVLLEIICCRRNIELVNVSTPDEITLSSWAYTCYTAGELHKLVEVEQVDFPTLERMIKVGLWCIQDDPALRPLMKNVILMLEGTMDVSVPPSPELPLLPSSH